MRFKKCSVNNFGSYSDLTFDFSNLGLALISGPTGSGKSTLMDISAWILYGKTAKDGSVDDVRNWLYPDSFTLGRIEVELSDTVIEVCRSRGSSPRENDLFWIEAGSDVKVRGKDIPDTQKLLEKRLGVSADLYITCSYFHEFSPTASFFITNAKQRRAILEKIANLDFPIKLAAVSTEHRKRIKNEISSLQSEIFYLDGKAEQLNDSLNRAQKCEQDWHEQQASLIIELKRRYDNFESEKASEVLEFQRLFNTVEEARANLSADYLEQLEELEEKLAHDASVPDKKCPTCGSPSKEGIKAKQDRVKLEAEYKLVLKELEFEQNHENQYLGALERSKSKENHFAERLKHESSKVNPFAAQIKQLKDQYNKATIELENKRHLLVGLEVRSRGLLDLYDLAGTLRGELVKRAVSEIEGKTNNYLQTYFDGEFRVSFQIEDSDKVEVSITKNGYECVYAQLSKGQRGMLKLAFVVSVMEVAANNAGIHFDNLFLDESLDGLDSELKVKAYGLFESLSKGHSSIVVIDHSQELKSMFLKQFQVSLVNDLSQIEEVSE